VIPASKMNRAKIVDAIDALEYLLTARLMPEDYDVEVDVASVYALYACMLLNMCSCTHECLAHAIHTCMHTHMYVRTHAQTQTHMCAGAVRCNRRHRRWRSWCRGVFPCVCVHVRVYTYMSVRLRMQHAQPPPLSCHPLPCAIVTLTLSLSSSLSLCFSPLSRPVLAHLTLQQPGSVEGKILTLLVQAVPLFEDKLRVGVYSLQHKQMYENIAECYILYITCSCYSCS
jgi:hypothetical protein